MPSQSRDMWSGRHELYRSLPKVPVRAALPTPGPGLANALVVVNSQLYICLERAGAWTWVQVTT